MTAAQVRGSNASSSESGSLLDALDLRLQWAVQEFRTRLAEQRTGAMHGWYISDEEAEALVTSGASAGIQPERLDSTRFSHLARLFALDVLDQEVLLVCLAPELDRRYERVYGYLQDDMTRRRSSVDLVLRLLGRDPAQVVQHVGPSSVLVRRGLLSGFAEDASDGASSFLSTTLRVDPRIAEYLFGADGFDRRLENWARLVEPAPGGVASTAAHCLELESLNEQFASPGDWSSRGPVVYLHGHDSAGTLLFARGWAAAVGTRLLVVDVAAWLATLPTPAGRAPFVALIREALLQDATLVLRGFDALLDERAEARVQLGLLRRALDDLPKLTFLLGNTRWEPATWYGERFCVRIELAGLSAAARTRLWTEHLDARFPAEAAHELGLRYRFVEDEDMRAVMQGAVGRACLRSSPEVSLADVLDAARAVSSPHLAGLARRLEPSHSWADIVLPADAIQRLRELCARIRHRATVYEQWGYAAAGVSGQGLTVLFVGPPGTGKTMAAEIVAADLGYDLYRIDLSAIVSKYIGETEKNLESIFRSAEQGEAVLLFDEADALFGKRSEVRDAHDRYANVEVAYLLQRLETYAGVAILTSNLSGNLDEAFTRRLDLVVEFRLPDENERREIWRRSLPGAAPRAADVDVDELARAFKLAGGHIRNSALTAAFLAADDGEPISRRHLLHAVRREHEKLGKLIAGFEPLLDGKAY